MRPKHLRRPAHAPGPHPGAGPAGGLPAGLFPAGGADGGGLPLSVRERVQCVPAAGVRAETGLPAAGIRGAAGGIRRGVAAGEAPFEKRRGGQSCLLAVLPGRRLRLCVFSRRDQSRSAEFQPHFFRVLRNAHQLRSKKRPLGQSHRRSAHSRSGRRCSAGRCCSPGPSLLTGRPFARKTAPTVARHRACWPRAPPYPHPLLPRAGARQRRAVFPGDPFRHPGKIRVFRPQALAALCGAGRAAGRAAAALLHVPPRRAGGERFLRLAFNWANETRQLLLVLHQEHRRAVSAARPPPSWPRTRPCRWFYGGGLAILLLASS